MKAFREYEFQFNGFNFISSVDIESNMYQQIKKLPDGEFVEMNIQCLTELLAGVPMDILSIGKRLERLNAGGTYAFIELGDN